MKNYTFAFFIAALISIWSPVAALAQPSTSDLPQGLAYCSEYFSPFSVYFTDPRVLTAEEGKQFGSSFFLTNENKTSISSVDVYVSVFREVPSTKNTPAVHELVAIVPVGDNLTFEAGEKKGMSFSWVIPPGLSLGTYRAQPYAEAHSRFVVAGISLTDVDLASALTFEVTKSTQEALVFERDSVEVNGNAYATVPFVVAPKPGALIPVSLTLANNSATVARGALVWRLYGGTHAMPSAEIASSSLPLELTPGTRTKAFFTIGNTPYSDYVLIGRLSTNVNDSAAVSVRIARRPWGNVLSEPKSHFSFVGTSDYPSAEAPKAFVCFNPASLMPEKNMRLEVQATGLLGQTLGSATYTPSTQDGDSLVALVAPLSRNSSSYTVTATLFEGNTAVDTISVEYGSAESGGNRPVSPWALMAAVLGLGSLIYIMSRRKNYQSVPQSYV